MDGDTVDPAVAEAFAAQVTSTEPIPNEPEDLTGDGKVLKTILKEGEGWQKPAKGISVKVHYTGTLLDGSKFDSSVDRGDMFSFMLGKGQVIKGWDITVASMRKGEKCSVQLAPEYAYGASGSPPKIPPNSTLIFEIELFEFDNELDISPAKDGGVKKLETKPSDKFVHPDYDSTCEIQYTVKDTDGKELAAQRTQTFNIGDESLPAGVQLAVKSLYEGGAAKITILAPYAYGSAGNADLNIPANITTVWEIELLSLIPAPTPSSLEPEQKIKVATEKKTDGNTLFTAGKYARALEKYTFAGTFTEYIGGDLGKEADELKTICKLNAAQCMLKLNQFKEAHDACTNVLKAHPENIKGLYRRAVAAHGLGNLEAALKDLNQLLSLEQNHGEAVRELARVKAKIKAQDDKDRALCSRMFQ